MKTFLSLLILVAFSTAINAAEVTLAWDHEQHAGEKYLLKSWAFKVEDPVTQARIRQDLVLKEFPASDAKMQTIELPPGEHMLTVQAVSSSGLTSTLSNELLVVVPAAPGNLRIQVTVTIEGISQAVPSAKAVRTVQVQTSEDLQRWREIARVNGDFQQFTIVGSAPLALSRLFWRASEVAVDAT